ncbi:MAG: D-aminoacylase [Deltaproteobacteria bacterium]|nr:MAG: D-aminoacylase [Deltaproteobacteria bacterium]
MIALLVVLFAAGPRYDLVISGGRLIDGTGAPWVRADVGIRGDRIAAIGDLSQAQAKQRIDAQGLAVAPGFIDLLGQSELSVLVDPRAESKIRQGITSELTGEGISPAPMNDAWVHEKEDWLRKYRLKIDWTDLRGYLQRLRLARPAINVGVMVGAAQVRGVVLGFDDVQPDAQQLARMQRLVEEAMEQGALGLSSGLIYQPGSFAKTAELIALAQAAAKHGGFYATHLRSEGSRIFEALDEAFAIARAAAIPVEIWHLKVGRSHWGHMHEVTARIERARASGIDVTADAYPYIASANGLHASLPEWVNAGGVDDMVARLRDPALRDRIAKETGRDLDADAILLVSCVDPELKRYMGKRLSEVAREMNLSPELALMQLVAQDRGKVGVARFTMKEEDVQTALQKPWVALDTDYGARAVDGPFGGEGAHPRAFGTMARILGHYVRDVKLFTVEEAVRKITSLPARRMGVWDRGVLRPGAYADVVVFDPEHVEDTATFEQPQQYPRGIETVVVNGKVVLHQGKRTAERPGRPLLRAP